MATRLGLGLGLGLAPADVLAEEMEKTVESEMTIADLSLFSDGGPIIACPSGHFPIIFRRNELRKRYTMVLFNGDFLEWSRKKECPIKPERDGYGIRTKPDLRLPRMARRGKNDGVQGPLVFWTISDPAWVTGV